MQKPLTLTLTINGEKHTFTEALVPLSKALEAATMRQKFEDLTNFNQIDFINAHVNFIAGVFHDADVNYDNIMSGLDARDVDVLYGLVNEILGINPN